MVEASAIGDDGEPIIRLRLFHLRRSEDVLPHEVDILRARRTFDRAGDQGVALSRVVERCAGLGYEGIILEKIESGLDGIVKVFRVAAFEVLLVFAGFVVTNSAKVSEHLASGNGPGLLRKRGTVFLYRGVEIELAALPELQRSGCGERFGDRAQAKERVFAGRDVVLEIGESESLSPLVFPVLDDGDREAGDMRRGHELGDRGFDLSSLFGSESGILSDATRRKRGA